MITQKQYDAAIKRIAPSVSDENVLSCGALGALYEQGRADQLGLVDQDAVKGVAI